MTHWFSDQLASDSQAELVEVGLETVRLGLSAQGEVSNEFAHHFATLTRMIVSEGGSVVVAENDSLLQHPVYIQEVFDSKPPRLTLSYAQMIHEPGFHVMAMPSRQWNEILTGVGATGIELVLVHVADHPIAGHPLIPVLQVTSNPAINPAYHADLDSLLFDKSNADWTQALLNLTVDTLAHQYNPRLTAAGNTQFQITRGWLGVSL